MIDMRGICWRREVMDVKLDKLIQDGENLKQYLQDSSMGGKYLTGEQYATWIGRCLMYFEKNHASTVLAKRFTQESDNAIGNSDSHYYNMLGYLKALKDDEDSE